MSIKAKINALRAKTTAAGCTEAEALAAAEMAARLMASYDFTADDLETDEARCTSPKSVPFWRQRLMGAVSISTNTAAVHVSSTTTHVAFFGRVPGPDIAAYLYEVCLGACKRELSQFTKSAFYLRRRTAKTKNAARIDFLTAMAGRLSLRLIEQFKPLYSEDDRQLAIRTRDLATPEAREMKAKSRDIRFNEAASAGWTAGARPALNVGIGNKKPQGLIA